MKPPKNITFSFNCEPIIYEYLKDTLIQATFSNAEELGLHCIKCKDLLMPHNSCRICKHWSLRKMIISSQDSMYEPETKLKQDKL